MMEQINTLLKKMKNINVNHLIYDVINENVELKNDILNLIKTQLKSGVNGDDVQLNTIEPYSEKYANLKNQSTVDLFDSGTYYNTFKLINRKDGFEITDENIYKIDFEDKYGNILSFNQENIEKLQDLFKPYIITKIKKYLYDL